MNFSENEVHSLILRSENEHFARRCRHYKSKDCKAESVSKRVPTYSALGKLFSPVPHKLPDGRSSTLFDEFLIVMSSVPGRIREGMLLLSGDVLLLFNPLQIDFSGRGAAAISFKENVETGKNHGVFLNGENNTVRKFLHKQTVETLTQAGAVNENQCLRGAFGASLGAEQKSGRREHQHPDRSDLRGH